MSDIYKKLNDSIDFFANLSLAEIGDIVKNSTKKIFRKDINIYRAGTVGGHIYIVLSGQVKIIESSIDFEYDDKLVNSGEYFGLVSLISNKTRTESAVCNQDNTVVLIISEFQLFKNSSISYRIYRNIAKSLSSKVRSLNKEFDTDDDASTVETSRIIREYNENSSFTDSLLYNVKLSNQNFVATNFIGASFSNCNLIKSNISMVEARSSNFSSSVFKSVLYRSCDFFDCNFVAVSFKSVVFSDCEFRNVDFNKSEISTIHFEK